MPENDSIRLRKSKTPRQRRQAGTSVPEDAPKVTEDKKPPPPSVLKKSRDRKGS